MLFLDKEVKLLAEEGFFEEKSWGGYLGNTLQRKSRELCVRGSLPVLYNSIIPCCIEAKQQHISQ